MSKQTTKNKPKRVTVLDIRKVEITKGNRKGQSVPKVQFAKGIEIFYNGEKLDLGEYNSGFVKTTEELESDIQFLVDNEYITQDQADDRLARLQEKAITGELQVSLK